MQKLATILSMTLAATTALAAEPEGMAEMEAELADAGEEMAVHEVAEEKPRVRKAINLSGPRIGVTYVLGEEARLLRDRLDVNPIMTQFGWQFEYRFFEQEGGFSGINEFLFLIGGLDQAAVLPSASWIIGVRSAGGIEVGAGPVIAFTPMIASIRDGDFGLGNGKSLSGIGFAVAAGVTIWTGDVNFPINLALVRSDTGFRLSLLAGFNLQDDDDEDEDTEEEMRTRVHQPETAAYPPAGVWTPPARAARVPQRPTVSTVQVSQRNESAVAEPTLADATPEELVGLVRSSVNVDAVLDEVEARKSESTVRELTPIYAAALAHESTEVSTAALKLMLRAPRVPNTTMRDLVAHAIMSTSSESTAERLYRYLVRWNPPGLASIQERVADRDILPATIRSHAEASLNL